MRALTPPHAAAALSEQPLDGTAIHALAADRTPVRMARGVWLVVATQMAVLLAASTGYGYHRDEMYFIVAGGHPAFGYPDQPPLVPLLAWAMNALAPGSLLLLRTPAALAGGVTTLLAATIARELGGDARAQLIAASCTAASGFALAVAHLLTTTTPDILDTTLLGWLAIRAIQRQDGRCVLAAGLVVGLGVEAKPQVGLVAVIMSACLLALGPRRLLRSPRALGGLLLAGGLTAPYLIWQARHGWPQAAVAHSIAGSLEGGRIGFIPFQLVMVSPLLVPVWVAGLRAPFRRRGWRDLRLLPITYVIVGLIYLAADGRAYYLASLYPMLLGLGAIPTADWTRRRRWHMPALLGAIGLSAAFSCVIALPIVPQRQLQGSLTMALNPPLGETVGWPGFIHDVSSDWTRLPATERAHSAIFTQNYGEAAAIDLLGRHEHLPRAYSGHNAFSEWGHPPARDTHALVLGFTGPVQARPQFQDCHTLTIVNNGLHLDNQEQGLPVMLCTPSRAWSALWPSLTHFD